MLQCTASFLAMLGILVLFAFDASVFGANNGFTAQNQTVCSPEQIRVTINIMSTCVSSKFQDEISKAHRKMGQSGSIFLNISGSTERDRECLRCHVRGKLPATILPAPIY